jgi:DNA helicase HerA-like ATPase
MGVGQVPNDHTRNDGTYKFNPIGDGIGIIYGTVSTTQFKFAISGSGKDVKRTGYIQVWHDRHGWVLGQIIEINLESKITYSKAQQISKYYNEIQNEQYDFDESNHPLSTEDEDYSKNGKLAGLVNVLGYRDTHNVLQVPSSPFSAGKRVYSASIELMCSVLGLDTNHRIGAYIGLLRNHDLKVYLNINELVQKHVSVIAKTGSGKSYMVGILVEELLKRKIPIIIIDPHGEYSGLLHPNIDEHDTRLMSKYDVKPQGYSDSVQEYSINPDINTGTLPLKLPSYGLSSDAISELLGLRGTGAQTAIMFKAINKINIKKSLFTLSELVHVIEHDRNSAKWHLINNLENLISTGIFSDHPTRLIDLVQPGRVTIINLRGVPPTQQQIAVTHLTRQLFEARKLNKIPAMMLVVEESHQFCPQQGSARSSNILKTIASEGRKFGLGMTLVSQRPAMVDKNVLSQCNTQIILKVTNPNDLKALVASVEGLNNAIIDEIQRLPISIAILIGAGIQIPIFVDIRVRETKHGGRPVDILSNVETFYSSMPQSEYGGYLADMDRLEGELNLQAKKEDSTLKNRISMSEQITKLNKSSKLPDELLDMIEKRFNSQHNSRFKDNEDEED